MVRLSQGRWLHPPALHHLRLGGGDLPAASAALRTRGIEPLRFSFLEQARRWLSAEAIRHSRDDLILWFKDPFG